MKYIINPFTDKFDATGSGGGPGTGAIDFLSGNDSVQVGPNPSGVVNLLGDNATGINITGNAGTFTETIHGIAATTVQVGTSRYATNAEAAGQTFPGSALTPANITSLFSTTPLPASQGGTGVISPTAHSLLVGEGSSPMVSLGVATNGQIPIGSTGADPVLATITAGMGVTVTNGAGSITLSASGGGLTWVDVTGVSQTVSASHGYVSDNAGTVTFTLPASCTFGDVFEIVGLQGGWTLAQNANQKVLIGSTVTTVGVGGSLSSTNAGDCISLVAVNTSASSFWRVKTIQGNITVV